MIAGHTKFSPDCGFRIWKYVYARADIDCLEDLIVMIKGSPGGFNLAVPTILNGQRNVVWYNWSDYLRNYSRTLLGITGFHKFEFNNNSNDVEVKRLSSDSKFKLIDLRVASLDDVNALVIEEWVPEPLTPARQWYLFTDIRGLINNDQKKDLVAPEPTVPRPRLKKGEVSHFKKEKIPPAEPKSKIKSAAIRMKDGEEKEVGSSSIEKVPRKRGRPKKNEPEEKVPKKRGRPKKESNIIIVEEVVGDDSS